MTQITSIPFNDDNKETTLENPALIFDAPPPVINSWGAPSKPPVPLVLIHDGGGTTFSYHMLYPIGRPVWGIQNTKLDDGGWWEGGVPAMGQHYVRLLEKIMPEGGDIILGGWSFGGLLSIEIASQLAKRPPYSTRPHFRVLGIIMIDSIYPKVLGTLRHIPAATLEGPPVLKTAEELRAMKLREKVDLNMTNARLMVARWQMPDWKGREDEVPPTVLLRCKEYYVKPGVEQTSFVDYVRDYQDLGWRQYMPRDDGRHFVREVVDVEGHHFNLFEDPHIRGLTRTIADAANSLEEPECEDGY